MLFVFPKFTFGCCELEADSGPFMDLKILSAPLLDSRLSRLFQCGHFIEFQSHKLCDTLACGCFDCSLERRCTHAALEAGDAGLSNTRFMT
ncbi:hypothetical protein L596_016638 [Steinernema carpocapsae]|uniref:Uncharacterized protein n=1 Tax=Steinernema carpocapsae TaxID=34508 RepID=A0A4U5NJV6_STECR|nr:hypothetical protein L596_016638 [Steinernema carpocapsae]